MNTQVLRHVQRKQNRMVVGVGYVVRAVCPGWFHWIGLTATTFVLVTKRSTTMRSKEHFTLLRSVLAAIAVLVLWNLGAVAIVRADTRNCTPTTDEIALFRNENFNGPCVVKGIGEHPVVQVPRNTGSNTAQDLRGRDAPSFSSIKVGANVETLACPEQYLRGVCALIYQDTRSLAGRESFPGREIRSAVSFVVRRKNQPPRCRPGDDQVAVWMYQYFFGTCEVIDIGVYSGGRNARSLRVGSQVQALLCNDLRFRGNCMVITPGYFSHWAYPRTNNKGVASIKVGRRNEPPSCVPGANQVALFEYGKFVGRCKVFGIGDYSSSETEGWADNPITSVKVGVNVDFTLCNEVGGGTRDCHRPLRDDIPDMFRITRFSPHVSHLLSVWRRGETPAWAGRSRSDEQPPPATAHDFTVWLAAHVPFGAKKGEPKEYPWWTGSYPTLGTLDGNLTRVANPFNSVWLGFLKSGYGSYDCGNPDAYVYLGPGETMTEEQMRQLWGSSRPPLPVSFVACSGATTQPAPSLPLNITYTRRR